MSAKAPPSDKDLKAAEAAIKKVREKLAKAVAELTPGILESTRHHAKVNKLGASILKRGKKLRDD